MPRTHHNARRIHGAAFTPWEKNTLELAMGTIEGSTGLAPVTLAGGELTSTFTFSPAQPDATYVPVFSTTWFTMIRVVTQTAGSLVIEFSNPPGAGDVLRGALL